MQQVHASHKVQATEVDAHELNRDHDENYGEEAED